MITDAIFNKLQECIIWIISLFPADTVSWSPDVGQYLGFANEFVDMPLLMGIVAFFIAYELVILGVRLILWLYNLLPLT